MRSLIFFALLLGAVHAPAIEILDPDQELGRLHERLGFPTWASAVKCGERVTYYRSVVRCEAKCSAHLCVDTCTDAPVDGREFDLAVEDCGPDQVSIYGTNNFAADVSRADFDAHGTWISALLQNFEHFRRPVHSIEIHRGFHRTVTLIENGQMRKELGYAVMLDVRTSATSMAQIHEAVFLPGRGLLSGLVYLGELDGSYFMKRKGVAGVR